MVAVDEEQARRILLVENRTHELAGYEPRSSSTCSQSSTASTHGSDALGELLDELALDPLGEDEPPPPQ